MATVGGSEKGKKRGGRVKGTPNKITATLKEAILGAFHASGGQSYLLRVAQEDPKTFCTLLGRVLPMEVAGVNGSPITVTINRSVES